MCIFRCWYKNILQSAYNITCLKRRTYYISLRITVPCGISKLIVSLMFSKKRFESSKIYNYFLSEKDSVHIGQGQTKQVISILEMSFYWKDVSTHRDHFHLVRCSILLFLKDVIGCHYYTHYINVFTSKLRVKDDGSTYVTCMRLFWIKQLVCLMKKKSYTIVCMKLILVKLIACGLPWTVPLFPSTMNGVYKFHLMWEKFTCTFDHFYEW
jgi:hypothetical protein